MPLFAQLTESANKISITNEKPDNYKIKSNYKSVKSMYYYVEKEFFFSSLKSDLKLIDNQNPLPQCNLLELCAFDTNKSFTIICLVNQQPPINHAN